MSIGFKNDLFGFNDRIDTKYTTKVDIPQYLPSSEKPSIHSLCDTSKYHKLMSDIKRSNVSEEEKQFLYLAATRHLVFNYSKVADFYAHSSKEMQELMEQSALVIIDINDAIANGYVKLSENIRKIMEETGKPVGKDSP